jgi:hypothetical protein
VTVAAAAEAPTLLMAEIFSAELPCAPAITCSAESSVCATAIIVMFF